MIRKVTSITMVPDRDTVEGMTLCDHYGTNIMRSQDSDKRVTEWESTQNWLHWLHLQKAYVQYGSMRRIPKSWRRGVIIELAKKGNTKQCNNWTGKSLLSVVGMILCMIIIDRVGSRVHYRLRKERAGYRKSRGQQGKGKKESSIGIIGRSEDHSS